MASVGMDPEHLPVSKLGDCGACLQAHVQLCQEWHMRGCATVHVEGCALVCVLCIWTPHMCAEVLSQGGVSAGDCSQVQMHVLVCRSGYGLQCLGQVNL